MYQLFLTQKNENSSAKEKQGANREVAECTLYTVGALCQDSITRGRLLGDCVTKQSLSHILGYFAMCGKQDSFGENAYCEDST